MEKVDDYIQLHPNFAEKLIIFRHTILNTGLVEDFKWNSPTYTYNGKNIVSFSAFKNHCGIWFFQGALLKDPMKKLANAQKGKTVAMRQWRFLLDDEIDTSLITAYINEAISNEKNGLKIKPEKKPLIIPKSLNDLLDANQQLKTKFNALTLTQRREFSEYLESAKKEGTKLKRLEKIIPIILKNEGLHDKYRKC